MKDIDKKLLKKWMNNELKDLEYESFKESEIYKTYNKIITVTNDLEGPYYNEKKIYSLIEKGLKENHLKRKAKIIKLNTLRISSFAAVVLVLIGLYLFMNSSNLDVKTRYGETSTIELPDGSMVTLNANSSLSFDKKNFMDKRNINLKGEAFFDVTKGSRFVVKTKEGLITVLGTKFNVDTGNEFLEVKCYSGKIKVTKDNKTITYLTHGKSVRILDESLEKAEFSSSNPSWINGISSFDNTPFWKVVNAIENQFNLKIKNLEPYASERFTGSFSNTDKENALQTVFDAMGLDYTSNGNIINIQ